jgi:exosome complex component RRP43
VSDNQAGPSTPTTSADDAGTRAEVFKRLHPDEYISRFLAQGYRPDGRKLNGWRDVSVNVGMWSLTHMSESRLIKTGSVSTADGSALIRMGDTTMVCGIKAEIAEPDSARPNEGFISRSIFTSRVTNRADRLVPNIDLPALCSPRFKPGPPVEEAQVYSNQLYDLLIS